MVTRRGFLKGLLFGGGAFAAGGVGALLKWVTEPEKKEPVLQVFVRPGATWETISYLYAGDEKYAVQIAEHNDHILRPGGMIKIPISLVDPQLTKIMGEERLNVVNIPKGAVLLNICQQVCINAGASVIRMVAAINQLNSKSFDIYAGEYLSIPKGFVNGDYYGVKEINYYNLVEEEEIPEETKEEPKSLTIQSPFGGLKKPPVHECKNSWRNYSDGELLEASICPFDNYGLNKRGKSRKRRHHLATDLWGSIGTPVYPMFNGTILFCKWLGKMSGFNIIIVSEDRTMISQYMHMHGERRRIKSDFKAGDKVKMSDVVGYVGATGNASASYPHVHAELYVKEKGLSDAAINGMKRGRKVNSLGKFRVDLEIYVWDKREFARNWQPSTERISKN
jgi:murein DD-endopeptidase MepM/ murein hydrolase activator NlpD